MGAIEQQLDRAGLCAVCAKVREGRRIECADSLRLSQMSNIMAAGFLANPARECLGGDRTLCVRNLHINYTAVCNTLSKICSFYRLPGQDGGYVLPQDTIFAALAELMNLRGTETLDNRPAEAGL